MFEKEKESLGKFLSFGSKPSAETFRELPDCLVWFRFILAMSYGFHMGFTTTDNQRGAAPLLMALNFVAFAPLLYCALVLQSNNDSYGGKLLFAGLPNAMALVLLIWIYFYTRDHFEEEQKLESLLAIVREKGVVEEEPVATLGQDSAVPPMEESEF